MNLVNRLLSLPRAVATIIGTVLIMGLPRIAAAQPAMPNGATQPTLVARIDQAQQGQLSQAPRQIVDTRRTHFPYFWKLGNEGLLTPRGQRINRISVRAMMNPVRYGLVTEENVDSLLTASELLCLNGSQRVFTLSCTRHGEDGSRTPWAADHWQCPSGAATELSSLFPADCRSLHISTNEGRTALVPYPRTPQARVAQQVNAVATQPEPATSPEAEALVTRVVEAFGLATDSLTLTQRGHMWPLLRASVQACRGVACTQAGVAGTVTNVTRPSTPPGEDPQVTIRELNSRIERLLLGNQILIGWLAVGAFAFFSLALYFFGWYKPARVRREREFEALKTALTDKETERVKTQSAYDRTENERKQLETERKRLEAELEAVRKDNVRYAEAAGNHAAELRAAGERVNAAEATAQQRASLTDTSALSTARATNTRLEGEIAQAAVDLVALRGQVASLLATNAMLTAERDAALEETRVADIQTKAMQKALGELRKQSDSDSPTVIGNPAATVLIRQQAGAIRDLTQEVAELKTTKARLVEEVGELQADLLMAQTRSSTATTTGFSAEPERSNGTSAADPANVTDVHNEVTARRAPLDEGEMAALQASVLSAPPAADPARAASVVPGPMVPAMAEPPEDLSQLLEGFDLPELPDLTDAVTVVEPNPLFAQQQTGERVKVGSGAPAAPEGTERVSQRPPKITAEFGKAPPRASPVPSSASAVGPRPPESSGAPARQTIPTMEPATPTTPQPTDPPTAPRGARVGRLNLVRVRKAVGED